MIDKETFCKYMREWESLEADTKNAHEALKKLDPDFGGLYLGRHSSLISNLLSDLMNDNHKDSWISYYVYELDFGKKANEYKVGFEGRDYVLDTPEALYDFIKLF